MSITEVSYRIEVFNDKRDNMKLAMYKNRVALVNDDNIQLVNGVKNLQELLPHLNDKLFFSEKRAKPNMRDFSLPIAEPKQIFAVGFNYRDHMKELKTTAPKAPNIFTKFVSSLTGPNPTVKIPSPQTDWETELVIVIGQGGRDIKVKEASQHIAGFMVGQDLSDRKLQFLNANSQFSLAKSYQNFSPIGPWLTTPDEIDDLGSLSITTQVNGVEKQHSQLKNLIFDTNDLVSYLSSITKLYPGDLIFTGTPGGVGSGRNPQEFLQPGDQLISKIDQLGQLTINFN